MLLHGIRSILGSAIANGIQNFAMLYVVLRDDFLIEGQLAHLRPFILIAYLCDLLVYPDQQRVTGRFCEQSVKRCISCSECNGISNALLHL